MDKIRNIGLIGDARGLLDSLTPDPEPCDCMNGVPLFCMFPCEQQTQYIAWKLKKDKENETH
jgi:hypothetical protein